MAGAPWMFQITWDTLAEMQGFPKPSHAADLAKIAGARQTN